MAWSADQYLKFAAPRLQPALDLLARVPDALQPSRVVDLGCGEGWLTLRFSTMVRSQLFEKIRLLLQYLRILCIFALCMIRNC